MYSILHIYLVIALLYSTNNIASLFCYDVNSTGSNSYIALKEITFDRCDI